MKRIGIALITTISLLALTGCVDESKQSSKPKVHKTSEQQKVYGNALIKTFSIGVDEKDNPQKYLDNKVKSYLNSIQNLRDYSVSVSTSAYSDVESKGYNRVDTDATIFYTVSLIRNKELTTIKDKLDEIDDTIKDYSK